MDILFLIVVILIVLFLGALFDAPWVPTSKSDYNRIASLAGLRPGMIFYDVGSGSGALLFYLSRRYGVQCVGMEISPLLYLYSKFKSVFFRNVEIRYGDFGNCDLSNVDVVYAFLMPRAYSRLQRKIFNECKEGARLVLSRWPLAGQGPTDISSEQGSATYYLYVVNSRSSRGEERLSVSR